MLFTREPLIAVITSPSTGTSSPLTEMVRVDGRIFASAAAPPLITSTTCVPRWFASSFIASSMSSVRSVALMPRYGYV